MTSREIELKRLGFEKNTHQQSYGMYKYGSMWTVTFYLISELDDLEWIKYIKYLKSQLIEAEKELKQEELYLLGRDSAKKEIKQKLLDKLNHLRSDYQQQIQSKMDRVSNFKYETELRAKINLLIEICKKV